MNEQQNQQPGGGPPRADVPQGGAMAVAPTQVAPQPAAVAAAPRATVPNTRRIVLINGIGLLIVLAVIGIGYYFWHQSYYFYNTDDAAVTGTIASGNRSDCSMGRGRGVGHGARDANGRSTILCA